MSDTKKPTLREAIEGNEKLSSGDQAEVSKPSLILQPCARHSIPMETLIPINILPMLLALTGPGGS